MSKINSLLAWLYNQADLAEEHLRKYRLILFISIEILLFGIALIVVSIYLELWFLAISTTIETLITFANILYLRKSHNVVLCSNITNTSIVLAIMVTNIWCGGIATTFFGWFYVAPIIAAITIGLEGLILYGIMCLIIMLAFMIGILHPISPIILPSLALFVDNINHLFIFALITTTLYNLLNANEDYESLLNEKNYLLYADKQKFHYLSHHDPLTNLPNRSYFHSHLRNVLEDINPEQNTLTLFFMDLDGFKKINDQYGHEVGDLILLQASKRLQASFREKDFIARLGGDEFTAVITYTKNDIIPDILSKRIEQEFKEPFLINNLIIKCTISLGRANYSQEANRPETLLQQADEAMYRNKKSNYFRKTQDD
ncbi:MAG: GGDEF domain-containing protein [Legionella sp.]|nr:MAG: GGDEF domain-containing protein [Legionella sp.]